MKKKTQPSSVSPDLDSDERNNGLALGHDKSAKAKGKTKGEAEAAPVVVAVEDIAPPTNDIILGTDEADQLVGTRNDEELSGGEGDDRLSGGAGNDLLLAGLGNDVARGGQGDDEIHGNEGNDRVQGGGGNDRAFGGTGNDRVAGGAGDDEVHGGEGDDRVWGGSGNDRVFGGSGNDRISGGKGNDEVYGDDGNDNVHGGAGDDRVFGGAGNDRVNGGVGNDIVDGGAGDDRIVQTYEAGAVDVLSGGEGRDLLILNFTGQEWASLNGDSEALRAELRDFRDAMAADPSAPFAFETIGLTADTFEKLVVRVDGKRVSIEDQLVSTQDDAFSIHEDDAPVVLDVLANDEMLDGMADMALVDAPALGSVRMTDGVVTFDGGTDFQHLGDGETETVTFRYSVSDTDGDTDTAEVSITVSGENDAPTADDVLLEVAEHGSHFAAVEPEVADAPSVVANIGGFYVFDADTGDAQFHLRGDNGLTIEDHAPTNGAVAYINPAGDHWLFEARVYSDGVGTPVPQSDLVVTGYEGELRDAGTALLFMDDTANVSVSAPFGTFSTPTGDATGSVTFDGLGWEAGRRMVDVGEVAFEAAPAGGEGPLTIRPDIFDAEDDALAVTVDSSTTLGAVAVNDDGTFSYDQGVAFAHLAEGEAYDDVFQYTVTDEAGASTTQTVTMRVTGVNDAPDARNDAVTIFGEESGARAFSTAIGATEVPNAGMFYVLDYDTGEITQRLRRGVDDEFEVVGPDTGIVLMVNPNTNSLYLEAKVFQDGVATTVDPALLSPSGLDGEGWVSGSQFHLVDAIADGSLTISIGDLQTPDGLSVSELTVSGLDYAGANATDAASVGGVTGSFGVMDTTIVIEAEVYDFDDDDGFVFSLDLEGTRGSVTNNGDGTFTYEALDAFMALDVGEQAADTFTYTVTDRGGATDTATITVTALGAFDDNDLIVG